MLYLLGFKIGFLEIRLWDIVDISLVAVLLYQVYKLMKGSMAMRVFLGFVFFYGFYFLVKSLQMELLSNILSYVMSGGILALIILFQNEIRKFLLMVAKSMSDFWHRNSNPIFRSFYKNQANGKSGTSPSLNAVVEAAREMSFSNTGALIVLSKNSELRMIASSGDLLDAMVSKRILMSIFYKNSPLHDGAVIIHDDRVVAARCILPVSENSDLPAQFGLRHRAAIGMTESSDVLVVVVSEETGQISLVRNGEISHNLSVQEIRRRLNAYLSTENNLREEIKQVEKIIKKELEEVEKEKKEGSTS
ncbi:diadenylate cyclase CdaA [Persicobacter sp. CCB-QB2]|uniref:diadenylate cyclase CdaA n=1 Tax=Persicobacter sp. CCB-QB2 TaxID=1561025 RepID=UPI0006A98CD0|nr:diadenylate cyclase CdaA [Persicobacter sp. CCB-QB2]